MLETFDLPFVQRGVWELLLLSVAAGVLGTWIVLRGLAFFAHATGTAAFPGLVVAEGVGFAAPVGALGAAALFAAVVALLGARRRTGTDSLVALALTGCLAAGVLLASDVFASGAGVERLLFGSLLALDGGDLAFAALASALVAGATLVLGPRWLARGFDAEPRLEIALVALVALAVTASLAAVGALLVTALFIVPAATTRLFCTRLRTWQLASVALAAAEGVAGLWLSVETNTPPGAAIAVVAGAVFAVVALARTRGKPAVAAAAAGAALLVAGCGSSSEADSRPQVVATTTLVADLARNAVGDRAQVRSILRPDVDPHEYEPRPHDVRDVARADVVVLSGGEIDAWMREVVEQSGSDAKVVSLLDAVPVRRGGDPHWWHDARNVEAAVERIAREVGGDPSAYVRRVRAMDRAVGACLARIPRGERKLVTDHDAFGYLAGRYGLEVVGTVFPGGTTRAQASAGELADLGRTIEREHVRAVFPEEALNPRVTRAIARQTGADASRALYGDALGAGAPTWLDLMRANADALARGLTGGERGCG